MKLVSFSFVLFFSAAVMIYYLCPKSLQWRGLLVASFIFYLLSDRKGFIFLLLCIIVTYYSAILISKSFSDRRKKTVLAGTAVLLFFCLSYFKLFEYYGGLFQRVFSGKQRENIQRMGNMIAPLGISYFTLQSLSYCIDVYRRKISPETNLLKYALFVSYFPLITQGPISRYDQLKDQLFSPHEFSYRNLAHGSQLILWGLIKKLVIADRMGTPVAALLDQHLCGSASLLGGMLFSFQLFADFSGCMDIVGGCSEILGIALPRNFNNPFAAVSVRDFWRRWHISLSTWLRDYVYIPLGGSRKGKKKKWRNILITFFISGLWHGAGVSFLVWGLMHGAYQTLEELLSPSLRRMLKKTGDVSESSGYVILKRVWTFSLVSFAWIFFRSAGLGAAFEHIKLIFTDFDIPLLVRNINELGLSGAYLAVLPPLTAGMVAVENDREKNNIRAAIDRQSLPVRWAVYLAAIIVLALMGNYGIDRSGMFLYARF